MFWVDDRCHFVPFVRCLLALYCALQEVLQTHLELPVPALAFDNCLHCLCQIGKAGLKFHRGVVVASRNFAELVPQLCIDLVENLPLVQRFLVEAVLPTVAGDDPEGYFLAMADLLELQFLADAEDALTHSVDFAVEGNDRAGEIFPAVAGTEVEDVVDGGLLGRSLLIVAEQQVPSHLLILFLVSPEQRLVEEHLVLVGCRHYSQHFVPFTTRSH